MKTRFVLDEARCVACEACAVACMDEKNTDLSAGEPPLRRCLTEESGAGRNTRIRYRAVGCMHCEDAPCIAACAQGCIYRDAETGLTLCDDTDCIGCRACEAACPFEAPRFDAAGKMLKCDGCAARVKAGLAPACVRACPFDALSIL